MNEISLRQAMAEFEAYRDAQHKQGQVALTFIQFARQRLAEEYALYASYYESPLDQESWLAA